MNTEITIIGREKIYSEKYLPYNNPKHHKSHTNCSDSEYDSPQYKPVPRGCYISSEMLYNFCYLIGVWYILYVFQFAFFNQITKMYQKHIIITCGTISVACPCYS